MKKLKRIPIYKLMPNLITVVGLCLGVSAVRFAWDGDFVRASVFILTAAVSDSLDGRVARLLKCESDFGAQLDSLSDIISFGLAPATLLYLSGLHHITYFGIGWSVALFYVTCGALRLARFNADLSDSESSTRAKIFFKGIPITAAACLSLLPLVSSFQWFPHWLCPPWYLAGYTIFLSLMMISRVPTFSGKKVVISERWVPYVRILSLSSMAAVLLEPWWVLPWVGLVYFALLPLSVYQHRRLYKTWLC